MMKIGTAQVLNQSVAALVVRQHSLNEDGGVLVGQDVGLCVKHRSHNIRQHRQLHKPFRETGHDQNARGGESFGLEGRIAKT